MTSPAMTLPVPLSRLVWSKSAAPSLLYREPESVVVLSGRLVVSSSGWGLVEVPNSLVQGLFQALDVAGAELPPGKNGKPYQAHISVMRPEEIESIGGPDKLTERGKRFAYQLGPVQVVEPAGWEEMSRCWFVAVRSPELMLLRRTYGLESLPVHPKTGLTIGFHLTFAVRRKNVLVTNEVAKR